MWRNQPVTGDFPPRSVAKHVFMEHRNANANRLERRAASVAAVAGRCDAHVIVVTPDDADGAG